MTVRNTRGMTMVEVFVVLVIMGILMLGTIPRIGQALRSSRVDRAAGLVALTLERSFTLASRQRRPVTVTCDCVNQALEIRDEATGTSLPAPRLRARHRVPARHADDVRGQCHRLSLRRRHTSPHRDDRRGTFQPADHDVERRARAGGALSTRPLAAPGAGFTLVETLATLALLCFVVAVLGPLLCASRGSRAASRSSQYRTAALVAASSRRHVAAVQTC